MKKSFAKKLKGGLKKCSVHRFGSYYLRESGDWYQCEKCGAFIELPEAEKEKKIFLKTLNLKQ